MTTWLAQAVAEGTLDFSDPEVRSLLREELREPALRRRQAVSVHCRSVGGGHGRVQAYVTTWDPYPIGAKRKEQIARGAFDLSRPVTVQYEHAWTAGPIGATTSAREDDRGVLIEAQLYLDEPRARNVWRAMSDGALTEWSVAFIPRDGGVRAEKRKDHTLEVVTSADLVEVSVVLRGANPHTSTTAVRTK